METHDFALKTRNFEVKADQGGEKGTFNGLASTYDVDQGNDRILPGAFSRTLASTKGVVPLLWQHQSDNPIGHVTCTETSAGLAVEGSILLSDSMGKKAYDLMKAGVVRGLSIGFSTLQEGFDNGVRLLKEVKLFEISAVTFPMNEGALIASVKGMAALSDAEKVKRLKSVDSHRKAIDRHQRGMREDLKSLFGSDLFPDDDDGLPLVDEDDLDEQSSKECLVEMQKMLALIRA